MGYLGTKPANQVIDSTLIANGAVTADDLASGSVTQSKLASGVAGNGPAFSAYQSSAQTLSSNTATKLTFTTEEFDTNNNFASSTFTPTVAGYYLVTAGMVLLLECCYMFTKMVQITKN